MKNKFFIASILFLNASFLYSYSNLDNKSKNEINSSIYRSMVFDKRHTDNSLMQSMNKMMRKMNNMQMTGDFDLDFANMMIIHHQGAIDMSKVEIAKGEDRQIRHMARKIIRKQKDEIEQLRDFIKNYELLNLENNNTEMHNELIEIMEDMMIKMESMQMTGDIDRDFARMMILHHRSAIKMAKSELSHGKQIELKEMAIKMIEDQKKEINKFKLWLSEQ